MLMQPDTSRRKFGANIILSTTQEGEGRDTDLEASPEELAQQERMGMVQALGQALITKRKEAMEHRANLGIELDWQEDDEYYDAKDRANPEGETNVGKPVSPDGGPLGNINARNSPARSTVFVPITRPYVDAAHARVSDMLLPNDDAPWSLKATPVQDALEGVSPMTPVAAAVGAQPPGPGFAPPPGTPPGMEAPQPPMPAGVAKNNKLPEELAAEEATKIITDWMIECQWHAEVRKMIEAGARIGTGVLKGPVATLRTVQKTERDPLTGGRKRVRKTIVAPASFNVQAKNCFPAPDCGEDIQKGSYHWEYDQIGARALAKLREDETYIPELIEQVLKEGPNKAYQDSPGDDADEAIRLGAMFPIWYFYGDVGREELVAAGVPEEEFPDNGNWVTVPAVITMANDTVIKAALNPLPDGGFPYDYFPWQRRTGMPWGRGVARQMRTPQRMLNAAVRSMMDNAGLTSGPLVALRRGWIEPVDGQWTITPRKFFFITEKAPANAKLEDCISFANIQSNLQEMELLTNKALKFAEDATGLPMLMQGQQGSAPDTVGGMTILNNNGSTVLRRLARNFDDFVTERHIRRYYQWLLDDPNVPESAKEDFQIDARGSTALVERDLQNQSLNQLAPILMQSRAVDPDKLAEQLSKANRIDWKTIARSDEELEQIKNAPPPADPRIEAVKLREQATTERETMKLQHTSQEKAADREQQHEEYLGELAAKLQTSTDALKAAMAQTAQKLNVQVQLSEADRAQAAITPPTEPAGRAPNGKGFTK